MDQKFFVESQSNMLTSTFTRWLKRPNIAEPLLNLDCGEVIMTSERCRVQGIEFALSAEGDVAEPFLEKAVKCFNQAGDSALRGKSSSSVGSCGLSAHAVSC